MKCQARITKEYKSRKADVQWPASVYGPVKPEQYNTLPVCGGDVTVTLRAVQEPEWGGSVAKLEVKAVCTRCKWPYWPDRIEWEGHVQTYEGWDVTSLLEGLS